MGIEDMVSAARKEDWDAVDTLIPKYCNDPTIYRHAFTALIEDSDQNVRDLGASILEKATIPADEFDGMRERVYHLMTTDDNPYVRYRSAFTLADKDPKEHKTEVITILKEALGDKTVAEFARGYLTKLGA